MQDEFGSIEIKHDSIIKRTSFLGGQGIIEIPKNKITSVTSKTYFPVWMTILGLVLIIITILSQEVIVFFRSQLLVPNLIIGIMLIVASFLLQQEEIKIESPTAKIIGKGKGAKKFYKQNKLF